MSDISELIAAIEAATGPSGELDVRIYRLIRPGLHEGVHALSRTAEFYEAGGDGKGWHFAPRYTFSLDEALTLVPCTWQWHCGTCNEEDLPWATLTDTDTWVDYGAEANTPTLAMCAASLKAKI